VSIFKNGTIAKAMFFSIFAAVVLHEPQAQGDSQNFHECPIFSR